MDCNFLICSVRRQDVVENNQAQKVEADEATIDTRDAYGDTANPVRLTFHYFKLANFQFID